ncbi:MAG: hypothetical protein GXO86_03360 [Chlorobi bacterium]|nr:hypothetical protein [Chlorobiota bacterium]
MTLFSDIIKDNLSGSGTILRKAQLKLIELGNREREITKDHLLGSLRELQEQFPQFGLLLHFTTALSGYFQKNNSIDGKQLAEFVNAYITTWKDSRDKASLNMINRIDLSGKNVLLHSNSSAIHNLFKHLSEKKILPVVWQTYSSPAGEGLAQARVISGMGFETHLIHEDALSNFMKELDIAILGTDLVLEDRFLNKAGSYSIALLFKDFRKPLYLLSEKRKKISATGLSPEQIEKLTVEKEKPATELIPDDTPGIRVHNLYFEFIPLSLVKYIFLD